MARSVDDGEAFGHPVVIVVAEHDESVVGVDRRQLVDGVAVDVQGWPSR